MFLSHLKFFSGKETERKSNLIDSLGCRAQLLTFWTVLTTPTAIPILLSSHWCWLNAPSQKWEIQVKRQCYRKVFQIWTTKVAEIPALAVARTWTETGLQMPSVHQLLFDLLMRLRKAKSSRRAAWYKLWLIGWAEVSATPQMWAQQQRGR